MATENNKKAVGLNAMLPYAVEDPSPIIDLIFDQVRLAYETGDLQEIILNCDHLAEYSYHQYEASIVKQMTSLVKLKYQFELKDLKRLVQLAYQVVISPPYDDASVRKDWSQLLLSLFKLKPMRHLTDEQIKELGLEWKPLYDVIQDFLYRPFREAKLGFEESCMKMVLEMAEKARKYFIDPNLGDNLLKEILPSMYPLEGRSLAKFVISLIIFMPNHCIPESLLDLLHPSGLLWSAAGKRIEGLNMLLLSRIAKSPLHDRLDIEAMIPFLFNLARRHLRLPGSDGGPKYPLKYAPDDKAGNWLGYKLHPSFLSPFAKWIVRMMPHTMETLEIFLISLDSFCHPSNSGSWTAEITHFLSCLVRAMLKRQFRSTSPLSDVSVFCRTIWKLVSKLVFAKNVFSTFSSQEILKGLAHLSPDYVLPQILMTVEASLLSVTEPHRTNASIGMLAMVYRKMLDLNNFKLGLVSTINLLHSIIPGIDYNDPLKTAATLAFFNGTFTFLPLYDLSSTPGLDDIDNENIEATASLESFVFLFLDQCFQYFRNISQPGDDSKQEDGVIGLFINAWDTMSMQLSPQLHHLAFSRILTFVTTETHLYAAAPTGQLVGKFVHSNQSDCLSLVLDKILPELGRLMERETPEDLDDTKGDTACTRIIWLLHILYRACQAACGDVLSVHLERLSACIGTLYPFPQKTIARLTGKLSKAIIKSLVCFFPREWRSWQVTKEHPHPTLKDVGATFLHDEVVVDWYRPSQTELNAALEFGQRMIELATINCGSSKQSLVKASIVQVHNLIKGLLAAMIHFSIDSRLAPTTGNIIEASLSRPFQLLIEKLSNLVIQLSSLAFLPVESKLQLANAIGVILTFRGVSRSTYYMFDKGISYLKSSLVYYKKERERPRIYFVKRAYLQHLARVECQSYFSHLTVSNYAALINQLKCFSLDHYSELSGRAQELLNDALDKDFTHSDQLILSLIETGRTPEIQDDTLKAILSALRVINSDMTFMTWPKASAMIKFTIALNDRPGIEKVPNALDLVIKLFFDIISETNCPPVLPLTPSPALVSLLGIAKSSPDNSTAINELLDCLLDTIELSSTSWRGKSMAYTALIILYSEKQPITKRAVRLILQGIASDIYDLRCAAIQASKAIFHLFNLQTHQSSRPLTESCDLEKLFVVPPRILFDGGLTGWLQDPQVQYPCRLSETSVDAYENLSQWENAGEHILGAFKQACLETDLPVNSEDTSKLEFRSDISRMSQGIMDIFGPAAFEIVIAFLATEDLSGFGKQRAIAEWTGGALKSLAFTQTFSNLSTFFSSTMIPLLKRCLKEGSMETSRLWFGAFYFGCRGRDPRLFQVLYLWLVEKLRNFSDESNAEVVATVQCLQGFVKAAGWRMYTDLASLWPAILPLCDSPFLVIRREAALLFKEAFRASFTIRTADNLKVSQLIDTNVQSKEMMKSLVELGHALFMDPVLCRLWSFVEDFILVFFQGYSHDDVEMQLSTKSIIKRLAWANYCLSETDLTRVLSKVATHVAQNTAQKPYVRRLSIEFIGTLYGRNYMLMKSEPSSESVRLYYEFLKGLLGDLQLDIREMASQNLVSLFHSRPDLADTVGLTLPALLTSQLALLKDASTVISRHAICLLAVSLVSSIPYRMPAWAPRLLFTLTRFLPDRQPIQGTVRRCFSEFKRTHADNWAMEREGFSEEELDAISELLVSPTYYA